MEILKSLLTGIYKFMNDVQVPFFGQSFPLWGIFLFGFFGGFAVWILRKFFG